MNNILTRIEEHLINSGNKQDILREMLRGKKNKASSGRKAWDETEREELSCIEILELLIPSRRVFSGSDSPLLAH